MLRHPSNFGGMMPIVPALRAACISSYTAVVNCYCDRVMRLQPQTYWKEKTSWWVFAQGFLSLHLL